MSKIKATPGLDQKLATYAQPSVEATWSKSQVSDIVGIAYLLPTQIPLYETVLGKQHLEGSEDLGTGSHMTNDS